ncbi:MAG: ABC transporter permease [Saprospiraceae bacterium]|nr:ABC transporter permease [Saprospiraceae bacterium]
MIGLYTFNELSFDTFHLQHNNIYRINKITNENSAQAAKDGLTPGQLAPALEKDLPEVVHAARFRPWFNDMLVSHDSLHLKLSNVAYADPTFLEIFDFPLLKGNQNTALTAPYSAVITTSVAQRFFGNADPIGKTLLTLNDIPVKITGIAKEIPHQSSIQFSILISWATITAPAHADQFFWMNTWTTQANYTFVQLREGTDPVKLGAKVSAMMHKNMPEDEFQYRPYLQSLGDIYLSSSTIQYSDFFKKNNKKVIYILPVIAAFILIIAAFNFINFSTALALSRAKETGVQKILGAQQIQLVGQFFSESFLLCSIAFMLAICIVSILLPGFNNLTNSQLDVVMLLKPAIIVGMGGLLLIISLLAGLYPAVFLSQFKAKDAFRKALKPGNNYLRKSLVTTQFAMSIILIIATFGVQQQMQYLFKKDLGFNKEQVLVLELANTSLEAKSPAFITALKQWSGVINITATDQIPGQNFNGFGIIPEGHTLEEHLMANLLQTDANFLKTYDIHLTKGRFFSPDMPTDTTQAIVINEAMVAYLNWEEPINQALEIHETLKGRVIGVIKRF